MTRQTAQIETETANAAAQTAAAPVARHARRGEYPADPPNTPGGVPIRLGVVYAVCYRFRVPIFRRLTDNPALETRLFVGTGITGTKTVNAPDLSGLNVTRLATLKRMMRSGGRESPFLCNPTVAFHLMRRRPDVLLIQGGEPFTNLLVLCYAKLFRKPIVWWSLGELRGRRYVGLGALYRGLVQFIERRCDVYLGYSSVAVDYFLRRGFDPRRCFNLINVVDTDLVKQRIEQAREQVEPLREQLGLCGKTVILYVGALTKTKRLDRLIEAFAMIAADAPHAHLLIVGDGPERDAAEALTRERDIASSVTFAGAVYDGVSAYFQLADLVVVPGTGGLVVSEAMTHALPVICAVGDGAETDLVENGKTGYHIPADGVEPLALALRQALSDAAALEEMGRSARRRIDEACNIERFMNEMFAAVYHAYALRRRAGGADARPAGTASACEVCGSRFSRLIRGTDGGDYRRCRSCRMQRKLVDASMEMHEEFEAEQQTHYDEDSLVFSPLARSLHRRQARLRVAALQRRLPHGRVLEIGPGMGDVLGAAREGGYEVAGVEHSPVLAEKIRQSCGVQVYAGALEELGPEVGLFDACISFHVIEHVSDPLAFLRKSAELTRPGGITLIATPHADSWEHRVCGSRSPNYSQAHLRLFSKRGMRVALEASGWEVLSIGTNAFAEASVRVGTALLRQLRGRRAPKRGAVMRAAPPRLGGAVLGVYGVLTWPLRLVQSALGQGNELFAVARRKMDE